jgi:transposase
VFKRDVLTTEVYTVVHSHERRRVIRRERVLCADPDCHVATTARMPPMPTERALYDCRFLAWIVVMKFVLLVPLDRIHHFLRSQGVNIAMGSLVGLIERAADLVAPIDGEHLRQLRAGSYFHFDGTGLKTLVVGLEHAWDGYLEVFTRDELTVFQFDMTKHADRLRERIHDFVGILLCDAEARNGAAFPGGTFAYCNAHPRRRFCDAEIAQPRLAVQGARFIQALYELEDQADLLNLTGTARLEFRQRRSARVLRRFRQWLDGVVARPLPPTDPVRKAAKYYLKHFDGLSRFLHHAELPLDNNPAEREFQRHAKLRQASLFAGSPEGAHRWAILLGVVRTAQKCGLDVMAYLTWVFERRGSHRRDFGMSASALTPMAYRERVGDAEVRSSA